MRAGAEVYPDEQVLAFVPARGGSKGIHKKNLAPLMGKPLIQYTLEAAMGSSYLSDIFVSTDDDQIAEVCNRTGVDVPYRRPSELARDSALAIDAVLHGLDWLHDRGNARPDSVLLLQPTSPLRTAMDIDAAIEQFLSCRSHSLISVHRSIEHPYHSVKRSDAGWKYLVRPDPSDTNMRRQDFEGDYFTINGAIFLAKTELLYQKRTFIIEDETTLYSMDHERCIDIDDPSDLKRAEAYFMHVMGEDG